MNGPAFTIVLCCAAFIAALLLRPGPAMGLLVASAFLWPEWLRMPIGVAQMSLPRMVALVVFVRLLFGHASQRPRFQLVDGLLCAYYVWLVIANILVGTRAEQLRTVIGGGLDTVLMYMVGRRVFTDPKAVPGFVKGLVITGIAMAPLGVIENISRWSPYMDFLYNKEGFSQVGGGSEIRLGMKRAFVSTEQPIFFGMGMLIVTGVLFSLRRVFEERWALVASITACVLAVLTSLSSGPWSGLMVLTAVNGLLWAPRLINLVLGALGLGMVAMEALSNRHFYHLISYISLDGGSAYYRSRLMEVAVNNLPKYWAFGYGSQPLDGWGSQIDGRYNVDVVNNYVIVAVAGGLPSMLLYIATKVAVLVSLVRGYRAGGPAVKAVCFGLGACLVALSLSEISVGLFGPALLLSFLTMGFAVSCAGWARMEARLPLPPARTLRSRPVRVSAEESLA